MKDEKTHSFALPLHYYNSKTRVVTLEASSSYSLTEGVSCCGCRCFFNVVVYEVSAFG